MIPNSIYTPIPDPAPPEASDETPFEHLSHNDQQALLHDMDKRDVVYLLLMTSDRVNELERALLKIRNFVRDTLESSEVK